MQRKERIKRLRLEDKTVLYEVVGGFGWTVPVNRLALMGEYTIPKGPYLDDHFLIFVIRPNYNWNEATFYCEGREEFLRQAGELLGAGISCGLAGGRYYDSQVMWPSELKGAKLFDFVPVGSDTFWNRLKNRISREYNFRYSKAVMRYLDNDLM